MNTIERITQLIARDFVPSVAIAVYMCLSEFKPTSPQVIQYGSMACSKLKEMQDQLEDDVSDD